MRQSANCVLTVVTMLTTLSPALQAAEPIKVRLTSGRVFTAFVDKRTSDDKLWLRYGRGSTQLLRPVSWHRVEGGEQDGNQMTTEEVRTLAMSIKDDEVEEDEQPSATAQPVTSHTSHADLARAALGITPPIKSVRFDAYLANWDGDVETDGLRMLISPLDARGESFPVGGFLQVTLSTTRRRDFNHVPRGRGASFTQLGRWTKQLRPDDFGSAGGEIQLPFQARHPEFDTDFASHAVVHVRFAVPGHGVFESTEDAVRVRPYSPLRDQLQRDTGQRFFTNETLGRAR